MAACVLARVLRVLRVLLCALVVVRVLRVLRVLRVRALVRAACACASTRAAFLVPPNSWQPRDTTSACTCSTCTPDMIQTSKRYSVPTCSRTPCVESAHA